MKYPEPLDYFPGHKPSSPAFRVFSLDSKDPKDQILQFDSNYERDLSNKRDCLNERESKYFQIIEPSENLTPILYYLSKLSNTYCSPLEYTFETLRLIASNIQEDFVIYDTKLHRTEVIHLCHANGWSAEDAIGKSFAHIHDEVRDSKGNLVVPNPEKFVNRIMKIDGAIERVGAISFNKRPDLNRHPDNVTDVRSFDPDNPSLFMRVERQTVVPFPEIDKFLFTIKTYFYDCTDPKYLDSAIEIFENRHENLYAREFVDKYRDEVLPWLKSL